MPSTFLPRVVIIFFLIIFLFNLDETQNTFSPVDINGRITKIVSRATIRNDAYWRISFEEGVDPLDVNDGALPQFGDDNHGFLGLKLVHTQWRYDFGFGTPSCMLFTPIYCAFKN
jgi:hypothetical protein